MANPMRSMRPGDQALLEAFVAAFSVGETNIYGQENWQPIACQTNAKCLESLYADLPGRFPPLYERLVLSYRWPTAELPDVPVEKNTWPPSPILLPNPLGRDLSGLLATIRSDSGHWEELAPNGYVQFARAWGGSYDPVCFDTSRRQSDGDCPVVQIDHKSILCNFHIKVTAELADSFRELVHIILRHG